MKKITIITLMLFTTIFYLCDGSNANKLSYAWDVDPIFRQNCFACHIKEETATNFSANLCLATYEKLMAGNSDNGPVVVKKYPQQSLLINKITTENPILGLRMPINLPPLTDEEIRNIDIWIYRGAKDN